jgi:hypothetical protein
MLVPFFAWWLEVSLWQAFVLDLGLLLFFLVYTFVFNWVFDRVFGLPASALPVGGEGLIAVTAPRRPQGVLFPPLLLGCHERSF